MGLARRDKGVGGGISIDKVIKGKGQNWQRSKGLNRWNYGDIGLISGVDEDMFSWIWWPKHVVVVVF